MVPLVCTLTVSPVVESPEYQMAPTAVGSAVGVTAHDVGVVLNAGANVTVVDVPAVILHVPARMAAI